MRKIRIAEHISLDGVIQPGGPDEDSEYSHGGWMAPYRGAAGAEAVAEAQGKGFDLLLGRRTYDLHLLAEDQRRSLRGQSERRDEIRRDPPAGEPRMGTVGDLGADALEGVRRLRSQDGPDLLVWGSATLAAALFELRMVDDMVLIVYPVLLGRGKRCFSDCADASEFALVGSKATPTGVLLNTYRHVRPLRAE